MAGETKGTDALRAEVIRLAPWAYDVEIRDGLTTLAAGEADVPQYCPDIGHVGITNPREPFQAMLRSVYPAGLEGRSALDCACNSGAYLFWAKELGAGRCLGFDIREHWIEQARFLLEHREAPTDDMAFELHDLYDLPKLGLGRFDVVFFHGIFYHLPDPVTGLRNAADLAEELLVVSTTTQRGYPDGLLVVSEESRTALKSGVYGLHWFPTGPEVMSRILEWCGFPATRCDRWRRRQGQRGVGREEMRIVAARRPEALAAYDASMEDGSRPVRQAAQAAPAGATVLVASGGDERLLELGARRAWHFPQRPDGGWAGADPVDGAQAVRHLARLQDEGAEYLILPDAGDWPVRYPELAEHLEAGAELVSRDHGCALWRLGPG